MTKALAYQQKALGAAANLEVFLMPLLIFKLFFGYPFLSFLTNCLLFVYKGWWYLDGVDVLAVLELSIPR